jgi:hypothetical protein
MAIEGFGESLLGEKRARDTKRKKKQQTYDALGAAASIGVGMYRESLRKKQDDFFDSEEVMAQKAIRSKATRESQAISNKVSEINNFGLGARYEYFLPEVRERAEASILAQDPTAKRALELGLYNPMIRERSIPLAKKLLANVDAQYSVAVDYLDSPSYAKEMKVANSKRPTTPFGNIFGFKSSEDRDAEALETLQSSKGQINAERVLAAKQAYQETRNLVVAHEYSEADLLITDAMRESVVDRTRIRKSDTRPNPKGGMIAGYEVREIVVDPIDGTTDENIIKFVPYLSKEDLKKNMDKTELTSMNKTFNIFKQANSILSKPSQIRFKAQALKDLKAANPNLTNAQLAVELHIPSTLKNYETISNSFNILSMTNEDYNNELDVKTVELIVKAIADNPKVMERINEHQQSLIIAEREATATGIPVTEAFYEKWQRTMDAIGYRQRLSRSATSFRTI